MATNDEPQKIVIGGVGIKYWSLIVPIFVFITLAIVSFVFPNSLPPGSIAATTQIDPATGLPFPLEPDKMLIIGLINGSVYGSAVLILDILYILRKK